jgi:hypothetical protein
MTLLLALALATPQADLEALLQKADVLLGEAKAGYDQARATSSFAGFVDAGFKLEEARIKYIVVQEIGAEPQQKLAAAGLRAVNQLAKLLNDGRIAVQNPAAATPAAPAAPDAPKAAPAAAVDVTKRAAVPDVAKQKDAEKQVRELFKADYAKKAPADRKALARLLLDQAVKSHDDPTAVWVLCREAEDVALQVADVDAALEAVGRRAELFDVDPLALREAALAAAGKAVKAPEEAGAVAEALLRHIDDLVQADQFEAADKAAAAAAAQAKKAGDPGLAWRASTRAKETAEMKSLAAGQKAVLQRMAKNAEEPGANLEMGKFLCFVKGSWDLGLRFLVKGSDAALKGLAEKELAYPADPAERAGLADGWMALADKERSPLRKGQMTSHAKALYEAALGEATGLVRARIEKKLESMAGPAGPVAGAVDLLRLIDPKRDGVLGDWAMNGKALACNRPMVCARLQVPYEPPEEYDITAVVERTEGDTSLYIGLAGAAFQAYVAIDDWHGTVSGIGYVDGKTTKDNETAVPGKRFTNGKPSTVVVAVRKDGITVTVDGKKVTAFKGATTRLSIPPILGIPNRRALFVGATDSRYVFSKLQLTPVTGVGKVVK